MYCNKCEKDLDEDHFNWRNKALGKRQSWCRYCQKQYKDKHYKNNKEVYKKKAKGNRKRIRSFILSYLKEHPCVDCGESDPIVLDFDHIKPSQKNFTIAIAINREFGLNRIRQELVLCEVRCANCHRRRTAKQFNWYKQAL